jgi:hypothetical protein
MADPITNSMSGRKLFYVVLSVIGVFLLILHTTHVLKLEEANENVQKFLENFGPSAFLRSYHDMRQHCWNARGWYNKEQHNYPITSGCDGSQDDEDRLNQLVFTSDILDHATPSQLQQFRDQLCQKEKVGCKIYGSTGPYEFIKSIIGGMWGYGWGLVFVWILGFMLLVIPDSRNVVPGIFFGPIIGSVVLLAILWTLEGLTYIFGYAFGFITWLGGIATILELFKEWAEVLKKDRERTQETTAR